MKLNLKNLTASLVIGMCAVASSYGMENFGLTEVQLNVAPQINQAKFTEQADKYLHRRQIGSVADANFSEFLNIATDMDGNFSTAARAAIQHEIKKHLLNGGDSLNATVREYTNGIVDEYTPLLLHLREVEKQSMDRVNAFAGMPLLPQIQFNRDDVLRHIDLLEDNVQSSLTQMVNDGIEAAENLGRNHGRANSALQAFADREARRQREDAAVAVLVNRLNMATNYVNAIHRIRHNIAADNGNVAISQILNLYANCCAISLIADNSIDVKNDNTINAAFYAARSNLNEALTASFFGIVAHMNAHDGNADAAIRHFNSQLMMSLFDSFCADGGRSFDGYDACQNNLNSLISSAYRYLQHGFECNSDAAGANCCAVVNDDVNDMIRNSYNHIVTFVGNYNRQIMTDQLNGVQNAANPITANRADALQQTLNIVNIKCAEINPGQQN